MKQTLSYFALVIYILSGVSAKFLKQINTQENDNFPEPPYCGLSKIKSGTSRIFGGTEVEKHEFPWMVYLSMGCGGTLINTRWVLSAAHCFPSDNPIVETAVAYLSAHYNPEFCPSDAIKVEINKKIVHQHYDNTTFVNDIALVQLKEGVTFTDTIQPICLPFNNAAAADNIVHKMAIIAGWGATEKRASSNVLLKANVEILKTDQCKAAFKNFENILEICAGGVSGTGICSGDSGGPLFMLLPTSIGNEKSNFYYQFGITSYGYIPCGRGGDPGAFTNVYSYIQWIKNAILANE